MEDLVLERLPVAIIGAGPVGLAAAGPLVFPAVLPRICRGLDWPILKNADLVFQANREVEALNPLLSASRDLVREGLRIGGDGKDMAAVIFAFEGA